jgi:hypothetical protein
MSDLEQVWELFLALFLGVISMLAFLSLLFEVPFLRSFFGVLTDGELLLVGFVSMVGMFVLSRLSRIRSKI